jgi:hypothetical protein
VRIVWHRTTEIARHIIIRVLSAFHEKVPARNARNAIYAHAQDVAASDELLQAILKTLRLDRAEFVFIPDTLVFISCWKLLFLLLLLLLLFITTALRTATII